MKQIHEKAREQILRKNELATTLVNKGRKQATFEPGEHAWVHFRKERFPNHRKSKLDLEAIALPNLGKD